MTKEEAEYYFLLTVLLNIKKSDDALLLFTLLDEDERCPYCYHFDSLCDRHNGSPPFTQNLNPPSKEYLCP